MIDKINDLWLLHYDELCYKARNMKKLKMRDYDNGTVSQLDYYKFLGEKAFVHEIMKKALRLVSLYGQEKLPETDSIEDSLIDLINYSADLYAYRKLKGDK